MIHLHHHDSDSILDGLGTPIQCAEIAAELGQTSLAQSNHATLSGSLKHIKACNKVGILPICSCFVPGQYVQTKRGAIPIEDVEIGDEVYTHRGRFRKVYDTSIRNYKDNVYHIDAPGCGQSFVTGEHPILNRNLDGEMEWVEAKNVVGGRAPWRNELKEWKSYVFIPKPNPDETFNTIFHEGKNLEINEDFAWMMGLFIAEGSYMKYNKIYNNAGEVNSLVFTLHAKEVDYRDRLERAFNHIGLSTKISFNKNNNSAIIRVHNVELARTFHRMMGEGCRGKRVPYEIFDFPQNLREAFVEGVEDGDAKQTDREVYLKLNNKSILFSIRLLLIDKETLASIKQVTAPSVKANDTYGARWSYSKKHRWYNRNKDFIETPVHKVDSKFYEGPVYNISVEDDESYVTEFSTHNCEGYFRPDRLVRDKEWRFRKWHYLLHAKNLKGWHNLIKITSEAYSSGFYQNPCFDWELLETYHDGLIASTACILGPLPFLIENGSEKEVDDFIIRSKKIFGEDFYMAIMPHDFDRQRAVNLEIISLANKHGIAIVYEGDSHYPKKGWVDTQKIAILIATNSTFSDAEAQNKKRIENNEEIYELWHDNLHIMDEKEVRTEFARNHPHISTTVVDEAIKNTDYIGSRIEPFIFDRSVKMPRAGKSPGEAEQKVIQWCREGLERVGRVNDETYEKRLTYELEVLRNRNNFPYIYLVSDWIRWCKSSAPLPGKEGSKRPMLLTCRGSAAASIVCYLTNITAIDPIAHKFKFERFINPERKGQPDIDVDLPSKRRNEAKQYLALKYGENSLADIMAQQHFQPRAALKNVTKVIYGFGSEAYESISKICHEDSGLIDAIHDIDLEKMKNRIPEIDKWAQKWPDAWEHAVRMENAGEPWVSRLSKHAAGTAITPGSVTDYMPTIRADDEEIGSRSAWPETSKDSVVDEVGIVKIDALGISGLDQHEAVIDLIKEHTGEEIDIDNLPCLKDPYDVDQEVMKLAQNGINLGVNQFSGSGISNYLKKLIPNNIIDLTAANALYRPGGMGENGHIQFAKRKNGLEGFLIHDALKDILNETYGVMAFQEQIMEIFQILMGYSAGKADDIRKTIDKKNRAKNQEGRKELAALKSKFIELSSKVIGEQESDRIWNAILPWTGYGFNRPHSGCYSIHGYKDWFLKLKGPLETYTVLLSEFKSKKKSEKEKFIKSAIKESRYFGIKILPPDVNISNIEYTPDFHLNAIRYGLIGIKGIAETSAKQIMELRPYLSSEDFINKHDFKYSKVNKGHRQKLLEVGALDSLGDRKDWSDTEKSAAEVELLGMSLSPGGTLGENESLIISKTHSEEEYNELKVGDNVVIGGQISEIKSIVTKKGKNPGQKMGFIKVSLGLDSFQCTLFPQSWSANDELLKIGENVMVNGRKDERGIIVNNMMRVDDFVNEIREQESIAA